MIGRSLERWLCILVCECTLYLNHVFCFSLFMKVLSMCIALPLLLFPTCGEHIIKRTLKACDFNYWFPTEPSDCAISKQRLDCALILMSSSMVDMGGFQPGDKSTENSTFNLIKRHKAIDLPDELDLTEESKDLIWGLLTRSPSDRLGAQVITFKHNCPSLFTQWLATCGAWNFEPPASW